MELTFDDLTGCQRAVLGYLTTLHKKGGWKEHKPRLKTIAAKLGYEYGTVKNASSFLNKHGFVASITTRKQRGSKIGASIKKILKLPVDNSNKENESDYGNDQRNDLGNDQGDYPQTQDRQGIKGSKMPLNISNDFNNKEKHNVLNMGGYQNIKIAPSEKYEQIRYWVEVLVEHYPRITPEEVKSGTKTLARNYDVNDVYYVAMECAKLIDKGRNIRNPIGWMVNYLQNKKTHSQAKNKRNSGTLAGVDYIGKESKKHRQGYKTIYDLDGNARVIKQNLNNLYEL